MQDANDLDLRSGDWQVLDAFHDPVSILAFQGLKRKLGLHQETLSPLSTVWRVIIWLSGLRMVID